MEVVVTPGPIAGRVRVPPSKSATHRALIAAAIGGGGPVRRPLDSADTRATTTLLEALGSSVIVHPEYANVDGFPEGGPRAAKTPIDCANSGTTLRFGAGLAALAAGRSELTGDASLRSRPNGVLLEALTELGAVVHAAGASGTAPIEIEGPLEGGRVTIDGSVSSQFVSSLLLAGSLAPEGLEITIRNDLVSRPYLDLTVSILERIDVAVTGDATRYRIEPGQYPHVPSDGLVVGGDPTAASYWLAAGALVGDPAVTIEGLQSGLRRPIPMLGVLEEMGIGVDRTEETIRIERHRPRGATIDLGDCPDLVPTTAVLAATASGRTRIINCAHARLKETDRIRGTVDLLDTFDVPGRAREDGLVVDPPDGPLTGGIVDTHGDHRLAMAAAVLALAASQPVRIREAEGVEVSYPGFFDALSALGAQVSCEP